MRIARCGCSVPGRNVRGILASQDAAVTGSGNRHQAPKHWTEKRQRSQQQRRSNLSTLEQAVITSHSKYLTDMEWNLTDAHWAILTPVISYWVTSAFYELLDYFNLFPQYRVRPSNEECKRNLAKKFDVLKHVLIYQGVQTALLLVADKYFPAFSYQQTPLRTTSLYRSRLSHYLKSLNITDGTMGYEAILLIGSLIAKIGFLGLRQLLTLIVIDTWVYWGHFIEHKNAWLYRKKYICSTVY